MIYQDNWLCKNCYRSFKKHLKEGELAIEGGTEVKNACNWCFEDRKTIGSDRNDWFFIPVDNLTQIELIAKRRSILTKKR